MYIELSELHVLDYQQLIPTLLQEQVHGICHISEQQSYLNADGSWYNWYQAYVLHSDLQGIEGLFEKSQDSRFTLWLSTDPSRIPLLIEIDLFFGTVKCKLVSAIPG